MLTICDGFLLSTKLVLCSVFDGCRKFHLSQMIWNWSVKGRTSTSVVPMSSGNGEEKGNNLKSLYPLPPLVTLPLYLIFNS